jgi:hypothetical protein
MTLSQRKKYGGLALAAFTILYYWLDVLLALRILLPLALPWHILFYFVSVVVWFIPSAALIWWIGQGK